MAFEPLFAFPSANGPTSPILDSVASGRPATFNSQVMHQLESEDAEEGNHLFSQFSKIFHRLRRFSRATALSTKDAELPPQRNTRLPDSDSQPGRHGTTLDRSSLLAELHATAGIQSSHSAASLVAFQAPQREPRIKHYEAMPMARAFSAALVAPAFASRRDDSGYPCVPVIFTLLKIKVLSRPTDFGIEQSEGRESFSRTTAFVLEISYGSHVKWTVVRKIMDFVKLHYVLMFRHFQKSLPKLPPFPSQIGYFLDLALTAGPAGSRPERASRRLQQSNARRQSLEDYLAQVCHAAHMHPCKELCEFLEISRLGLALAAESTLRRSRIATAQQDAPAVPPIYHKDKEGYLRVRQKENRDPLIPPRRYCRCLYWFANLFRCSPSWRSSWVIVGSSYVAIVDSLFQGLPSDVFIVDAYTKISGTSTAPSSEKRVLPRLYESFTISNGSRVLELRAPNELQHNLWYQAINTMIENSNWHQRALAENVSQANMATGPPCVAAAFSLPRQMPISDIHFFIDGESYFDELFCCLAAARHSIYISGWWVSPELYLQRPPYKHPNSRLDRILAHKASQGVQVYVLIFKEISMAVTIDSSYTKAALQSAHPNIRVQRHPDHTPGGVLYWAQHEKIVVIDQTIAFLGGLDLCYGRYDTVEHMLIDQVPRAMAADDHKGLQRQSEALSLPRDSIEHSELDTSSPTAPSPSLPARSHSLKPEAPNEPTSAAATNGDLHVQHDESMMLAASVLQAASCTQPCPSLASLTAELSEPLPAQVSVLSVRSDSLACRGVIWPGLDYSNPRIRDFRNIRQFETALVDRTVIPRMPWHDIHIGLMGGDAVKDLVHHFITKWNNVKLEKSMHRTERIPFLLPIDVDYRAEKRRFLRQISRDLSAKAQERESERLNALSSHHIYAGEQPRHTMSKLSIVGMEPVPEGSDASSIHSSLQASSYSVSSKSLSLHSIAPDSTLYRDGNSDDHDHSDSDIKADERQDDCCIIQVIRSSSFWSNGLPRERSIHEAYLKAIRESESFIYIENQFFISRSLGPQDGSRPSVSGSLTPGSIQNLVSWALCERIVKAHRAEQKFRVYITVPLFPAFESDVYLSRASSVRMLMEAQLSTIRRGPLSLYSLLEKEGVPIDDYITMLSLRTFGKLNDKWVTEQVYVHSKLMIVDDRVMVVGSANINDRSMLGDRDAELCVIVTETHRGQAHSIKAFRKRLFREHLGMSSPADGNSTDEERLLDDPCSDEFYHGLLRARAAANTDAYRESFHCVPDDSIATWEDYRKFLALPDSTHLATEESLGKVKGNFVFYPIHFLSKEDLVASILSPEYLLPAEVYY